MDDSGLLQIENRLYQSLLFDTHLLVSDLKRQWRYRYDYYAAHPTLHQVILQKW